VADNSAQGAPAVVEWQPGNVSLSEPDRSGIRLFEADNQVEGGRLARTIWPKKSDDLSRS
jgi:hypothetical protein